MNFDFSIESSIDKIQNKNTKEYFKEVYHTFVNGNYRSSTVMLYSVLVCDLIYKLRDLRDTYSDTTAEKILKDIEDIQIKSPTNPDWENKLIEFIKARTSLLEPSDLIAIESLQKFRHLSAHPILNSSDLLYSPNKETVQSLIRNILEGILVNPPFFSNKVFDSLLIDLEEVKERLEDDRALEKYIESRYLKRLKESDIKKIFRSLWKLVFITDDTKSKDNRKINYKVLKIIIKNNYETLRQQVASDSAFYCNINKNDGIRRLIRFLSLFPLFYQILDSSLKLLIETEADASSDSLFTGWYIKTNNIKDHLQTVDIGSLTDLPLHAVVNMKSICNDQQCLTDFVNFLVRYFAASNSYDTTKNRFKAIELIKEDLNFDQLSTLLTVSNENSQIYGRFGMKTKLTGLIKDEYKNRIDEESFRNLF